jgi:hypothetical protein
VRDDPGPLEALLRLRDLAVDRERDSLAGLVDSLRAEQAALATRLADLEAALGRADEAARVPAPREVAGLRTASRFRERLRRRCQTEGEAVRAQRQRVEAASWRAVAARAALAAADARREAVAGRLRSWRATRRAAREAAQEEERDGIALSAMARG